jgi:DNA-directed RNA polymerase subunit alpha
MKKNTDFTKPKFSIVNRIDDLDIADSIKEYLKLKDIFSVDTLKKITENERKFDELVDNDGQKKLEIIRALSGVTDYSQVVEISPLPSGYGITIGNALRRVLLSSMPGVAIIAVSIRDVNNEFSAIDGIYQDVTQIILNLKDVVLKYTDNSKLFEQGNLEVYSLTIDVKGKQTVCAKDIICPSELEVVNGEKVIVEITKENVEFVAKLYAVRGIGYVVSDINKKRVESLRHTQKINELQNSFLSPIDSIFTPIKKFTFEVVKTREEQEYNLDKLLLTIDTNLSIDYKDAIALASEYLKQYFDIISNISEEIKKHQYITDSIVEVKEEKRVPDVNIAELGLNQAIYNKLTNGVLAKYKRKINTVSELLTYSQKEIKEIPGFGEASVKKVVDALSEKGFEMVVKKKDALPRKEELVVQADRETDENNEQIEGESMDEGDENE